MMMPDRRRRYLPLLILALAAAALAAAAVLLLPAQPFLLVGLVASLMAAFAVMILYGRPLLAVLAFVLLLPVHSFVIALLIGLVDLPLSFVRAAAAWKEALLFLTMLVVLMRVLARRRLAVLTWLDAVTLIWLAQIVVYLVMGSLIPGWQPSILARLYGARDWLLYLMPFIIGRVLWISEGNAQKVLKAILLIGVLTSIYGVIEYFLLPISFHVQIGVPRYFSEVLGLAYPDYLSGLPFNYWAEVAGRLVRRSVSTYLSGQGFAVPFLLIIPVALVWYLRWPSTRHLFLFAVCLLALLLTITRLTIIVCLIQILLILLLTRRYRLVMLLLSLGVLLAWTVMAASPSARAFVVDTVLFRDTSSSARPGQWIEGIEALVAHPLGGGLGYAGQTGARFGGSGVGQESGYFKITGDLGLPGLLLFLAWFSGILLYSLNLYYMGSGAWKMLGLIVFAAAVGFLLNNLTAPPDQSVFLIYVFPFLAGVAARQYASHKLSRQRHGRPRLPELQVAA